MPTRTTCLKSIGILSVLLLLAIAGASCSAGKPVASPVAQSPAVPSSSQSLTLEEALASGKPTLAEFGADT